MNCMKCGREIEETQVFCDFCLADMKKYPVKPGIAIQLHPRKDSHPVKKSTPKRRQPPTVEEQIIRLKKRVKSLIILWLVTFLLLAATIYPTIQFFRDMTTLLPGQNYTTITDSSITQP